MCEACGDVCMACKALEFPYAIECHPSLISAGLSHEIFPELTSGLTANSGFRDFSPSCQQ